MRYSKLRRWLIGMAGVLFLCVIAFMTRGRSSQAAALDSLLIATVSRGDLEIAVMDIGRIEPREKVAVKSKVAGQVAEILVEEGTQVKKGQLLLTLEPEEFERNLNRAREEVRKLRVEAKLAKTLLDRRVLASAQQAVARTEVDTAESDYATRRIALKQAKEAERTSQDQLRYSRIVSPIDGTIIQRNIRIGETVVPGTMATMDDRALMQVADLRILVAKAELNQIDVTKVKVGQDVTLVLDAIPGKTYRAKVSRIATTAIQVQGREVEVFPIEATLIDNDYKDIRPGMTADLKIHVETRKNVLKLPIEAITRDKGRIYVNRVLKNPHSGNGPVTSRVDVRVGTRNDREQEILSGLEEGDDVLIKPPTAEANEYN